MIEPGKVLARKKMVVFQARSGVEQDDSFVRLNPVLVQQLLRGDPNGSAFGASENALIAGQLPDTRQQLRVRNGDRGPTAGSNCLQHQEVTDSSGDS